MLLTVLVVVLILMLIGAMPTWRHSAGWGHGPVAAISAVLILVLILMLMGKV